MAGSKASTESIKSRFRLPPPRQPLQLATAGPDPFHELGWHQRVLAAVHLAAQRRALQRAAAQVECERRQRSELAVAERHRDQPQHGAFGDTGVAAEQVLGFILADATSEAIAFFIQDNVAIADGGIAGWADVDA